MWIKTYFNFNKTHTQQDEHLYKTHFQEVPHWRRPSPLSQSCCDPAAAFVPVTGDVNRRPAQLFHGAGFGPNKPGLADPAFTKPQTWGSQMPESNKVAKTRKQKQQKRERKHTRKIRKNEQTLSLNNKLVTNHRISSDNSQLRHPER